MRTAIATVIAATTANVATPTAVATPTTVAVPTAPAATPPVVVAVVVAPVVVVVVPVVPVVASVPFVASGAANAAGVVNMKAIRIAESLCFITFPLFIAWTIRTLEIRIVYFEYNILVKSPFLIPLALYTAGRRKARRGKYKIVNYPLWKYDL